MFEMTAANKNPEQLYPSPNHCEKRSSLFVNRRYLSAVFMLPVLVLKIFLHFFMEFILFVSLND